MSVALDLSGLNKALKEYRAVSRRDDVEIVNRTARDIVLRAVKYTPKADAAVVRADAARLGLSREETAKRVRSIGYIKAGWVKAARALGGRAGKVSERGRAAEGGATLARPGRLTAEFINRAVGALLVGEDALQKAVDEVTFDKSEFARRKKEAAARRFSNG